MLKVMKGDRPDRPPSGLSKTLWNLMVATWVEQYAEEPCKRPSASTVLARLKECVDDWGKSILPLIPEDWENPTQQPNMTEMVRLLRELRMTSLFVEADLRDFLEVCESRGRDGQGEKARKFADKLDEVRHTESHNVNFSHHRSRHLTTQIFLRKNGSNI